MQDSPQALGMREKRSSEVKFSHLTKTESKVKKDQLCFEARGKEKRKERNKTSHCIEMHNCTRLEKRK